MPAAGRAAGGPLDKRALIDAHAANLRQVRDDLGRSLDHARQGLRVDGDHRPENRGERAAVTSQGYLTAGLERRARQVEADLELLERVDPGPRARVATGALVRIDPDDGEPGWVLVLPGGQGERRDGVTVISPSSPLARALAGLEAGEWAELTRGGREVEVEVVEVR